jgi:hypothetical protein
MLNTDSVKTKMEKIPKRHQIIIEQFIDEFGDDFVLDDVKVNRDDGGKCLEVYVDKKEAYEARDNIPHLYNGYRTIVIGINLDD